MARVMYRQLTDDLTALIEKLDDQGPSDVIWLTSVSVFRLGDSTLHFSYASLRETGVPGTWIYFQSLFIQRQRKTVSSQFVVGAPQPITSYCRSRMLFDIELKKR